MFRKTIQILILYQAVLNAFGQISTEQYDDRIINILSILNPDYEQAQIEQMAQNRTDWSAVLDRLTSDDWLNNCEAADSYYEYLADQIVLTDNDTFTTYGRLTPLLGCKTDCDFDYLLSKDSNFTNGNSFNFALHVVQYLPVEGAEECSYYFPALTASVENITTSDLFNDIDKIVFLSESQLDNFDSNASITLAAELSNSNKKLSKSMLISLGSNIASNETLDRIAAIASAVPLECITETSPQLLANLSAKMDINNMDPFRIGFIASQIATSNDSGLIGNLLMNVSDQTLVNSFSVSLISGLNLSNSSIMAKNLPLAFVIF